MTEESTPPVRYLDKELIAVIHEALLKAGQASGDPIAPFSFVDPRDIDALVNAPQRGFFGQEAYPTLAEKAAIIFYTINKRQIFQDGNKRMSTLCLLVFLMGNNKTLDVTPDQLTDKAIWLAKTASLEFPSVKTELVSWIETHLRDLPKS